jgi:hypothetical protein
MQADQGRQPLQDETSAALAAADGGDDNSTSMAIGSGLFALVLVIGLVIGSRARAQLREAKDLNARTRAMLERRQSRFSVANVANAAARLRASVGRPAPPPKVVPTALPAVVPAPCAPVVHNDFDASESKSKPKQAAPEPGSTGLRARASRFAATGKMRVSRRGSVVHSRHQEEHAAERVAAAPGRDIAMRARPPIRGVARVAGRGATLFIEQQPTEWNMREKAPSSRRFAKQEPRPRLKTRYFRPQCDMAQGPRIVAAAQLRDSSDDEDGFGRPRTQRRPPDQRRGRAAAVRPLQVAGQSDHSESDSEEPEVYLALTPHRDRAAGAPPVRRAVVTSAPAESLGPPEHLEAAEALDPPLFLALGARHHGPADAAPLSGRSELSSGRSHWSEFATEPESERKSDESSVAHASLAPVPVASHVQEHECGILRAPPRLPAPLGPSCEQGPRRKRPARDTTCPPEGHLKRLMDALEQRMHQNENLSAASSASRAQRRREVQKRQREQREGSVEPQVVMGRDDVCGLSSHRVRI